MNLPAHIFLPLHLEVRYSNWKDETKVCKPDLASCSRGHFVYIHILTISKNSLQASSIDQILATQRPSRRAGTLYVMLEAG